MRTLHKGMGAVGVVVAALSTAALGLAACSSSSKPAAPTTSGAQATVTTAAPLSTTTSAPAQTSTMDVRVYLLRGDKLDVAHRAVARTQQVATAAMQALLAGPTADEAAAGLGTTVPTGTRLLGISIAGGTATVDLSGAFASGGGSLSMMARLAQVTFTLTQFPTVDRVAFHLDGQPVTAFGGEGIMLDHPATRATFESVAPAILVESPARGSAVQSPVRITGSANVFEAQFQAELAGPDGAVIAHQAVHATSGTGTRGTFDVTIPFTASGTATLRVFDLSPKDGARTDIVEVPLQLVAS